MGNEFSAAKDELYIRTVFDVVDRTCSSSSQTPKPEAKAFSNQDRFSPMQDSPSTRKKFDLSPKNLNIAVYCRSLINVHFTGQHPMPNEDEESPSLVPPTVATNELSLSEALAGVDELLRNVDNDFSGHEEEFNFFLQGCIEARGSDMLLRRKFLQDANRFVQIFDV